RMLAYFLTAPWSGHLSDRRDRRLAPFVGCLFMAVSAALALRAHGLASLLVVVVVSGVGSALFWPPLMGWLPEQAGAQLPRALAADLFPTLAKATGHGPTFTSALLSVAIAGRVAVFLALFRPARLGPRLAFAALVLVAAGLTALGFARQPLLIGAGFLIVGAMTGLGYYMSVAA